MAKCDSQKEQGLPVRDKIYSQPKYRDGTPRLFSSKSSNALDDKTSAARVPSYVSLSHGAHPRGTDTGEKKSCGCRSTVQAGADANSDLPCGRSQRPHHWLPFYTASALFLFQFILSLPHLACPLSL